MRHVPELGSRLSLGRLRLWPVTCRSRWRQILSARGLLMASEGGSRHAWCWDSLTMPLPFAELIGHQTSVNVQTRLSRAASGGLRLCSCQSCRQELLLLPSEGFPSSFVPRPACSCPSSLQGLIQAWGNWKSS